MNYHELYTLALNLFERIRVKYPDITDVQLEPTVYDKMVQVKFHGFDDAWETYLCYDTGHASVEFYYGNGTEEFEVIYPEDLDELEGKMSEEEFKQGKDLVDLFVQYGSFWGTAPTRNLE